MFRKIVIILVCLLGYGTSGNATELRKLIPGKDFTVLEGELSKRPQVVEYFNYACNACYSMERFVMAMKRKKTGLVIAAMPVENYPNWRIYVEAFYLAQSLGVLNDSHHQLYHRLQVQKKPFKNTGEMKKFFLGLGVTETNYDMVKNSQLLAKKVDLAREIAIKNKIAITPAFVVNNKYKLNINSLGTYEMLEKAFDELSDLNYKLPVPVLVPKKHKNQNNEV